MSFNEQYFQNKPAVSGKWLIYRQTFLLSGLHYSVVIFDNDEVFGEKSKKAFATFNLLVILLNRRCSGALYCGY